MGSDNDGPSNHRHAAVCVAFCPVTGRPPYGYRLRREGDETVFEPDPRTAPVVQRIFEEYVGGSGLQVIAERLTVDGIPRPSAYDPQRNPHHSGSAWSKAAVRAIITNGRYAASHTTADLRIDCSRCDRRCAGRQLVTLVSAEVYRQTRDILALRGGTACAVRSQEQPAGRYVLRGLLRCELCQRLMQGTWNNDAAYYRCRFPREYARANSIDHPANVYIREDRLMEPLLDWICGSLPPRLYDLAAQQPQAARTRLVERCHELRELVSCATRDRVQYTELCGALGMRLIYRPRCHDVLVRTAVLPGMVVQGIVELGR